MTSNPPEGQNVPFKRTLPDSLIVERSGLTHARLSADVSEIEIMCVLANVEITVPPDIRVLYEGEGPMGSFETQKIGEVAPVPIEAPTVKITGNAYLGSVTVKMIGKLEPGWRGKLKAWAALNS